MNPFSLIEKELRPYLWGFFISVALLLVLVAARNGCAFMIERQWIAQAPARQQELAEIIASRFKRRVADQFAIAGSVVLGRDLPRLFEAKDPASVADLFQHLDRSRRHADVSIDIVDSQGVVAAWSGRGVVSDYRSIVKPGARDSIVTVPTASLHRYLSVVLAFPEGRFFVAVNRPLEVNYPISNRFVTRSSFSEELSQKLERPIRLVFDLPLRDTVSAHVFVVPLQYFAGEAVAYALVPLPTVGSEIQDLARSIEKWESILLAIGSVLLAFVLYRRSRALKSRIARLLIAALLLWGVRLTWRVTDFPAAQIGGFLFDPTLYASLFALQLTSSLGELLLSCIALFLTSLLLFAEVISWRGQFGQQREIISGAIKAAAVVLLPALGFGFQWIVRGFGAALRSFVFDSTLQFRDPSTIVPDISVLVMHVNILFLTLSLLLVCVTITVAMVRLAALLVPSAGRSRLLLGGAFVILISAYAVFLSINKVPQTPLYYPILMFIVTLYLASPHATFGLEEQRKTTPQLRRIVLWGGIAFVLSALLLEMWQHEKERQRVQVMADELLRPVDNWLSFVVSDALRTAVVGAGEGIARGSGEDPSGSNLAFILWAQTLMSREGYNSAVFVYDRLGKEISRFSVGLTSYEQMELLSKIFETEEEVLHVVERKVQGGTIKYYGEWTSILDTRGEAVGTVAVMLSASQRTLFRGEAPEPLRAAPRGQFDETFRKVSISEYQRGLLVSTTDPLLFRGLQLPAAVQKELSASTRRYTWLQHDLGGQVYDVLYARDESDEGRVLALGLQTLDVRWNLFNLLKMLAVYIFLFGLGAFAYILCSSFRRRSLRLGFREKLVSAFAILSVLPLVLMAYYNRELAIERLDENITRRLADDLDIIHQRIANSVLDDEDFHVGINNDYCEIGAADLGVDFSVYSGPNLQAASRPELYRAAILDSRLTGTAFVNTMVLGRGFYRDFERIGEVRYIVGYRPIVVRDRMLGVLAVPALYRQREIEEELSQRNAFVLGAYAVVVLLVVIVSFVLANRLSKPLRELSLAAHDIGRGNLDVHIKARSADEVGDLVHSFNEMTRELKASRENLARVERDLAWKEMAKQVAHEIKNPLTPIKLSVQHLLQAYRDGAQDFAQILQRVSGTVIEQIEVLARIASEFSDFARMPERRFERVDVKQLLEESVALFGEVHGIEFRTNFSEIPANLVADRDELRRVFINVIRNSVQAMDKGGTITVEMEVVDRVCRISISDTGSGIPKELQANVFEPNFSTKTDGMGLGLAIARKVIEDLNGTIALRSVFGKGTTVEMRIPLKLG